MVVTMIIIGLWHEITLAFLLWGVLQAWEYILLFSLRMVRLPG